LRVRATARDMRLGRLPERQQAAPERGGERSGVRRDDPRGDLARLHGAGDAEHEGRAVHAAVAGGLHEGRLRSLAVTAAATDTDVATLALTVARGFAERDPEPEAHRLAEAVTLEAAVAPSSPRARAAREPARAGAWRAPSFP